MLVGRLKPARVYWYRFTDGEGNGSRVGRTITAPRPPINLVSFFILVISFTRSSNIPPR